MNTDSNAICSQATNTNFKFPKRSEQVNLSDFIRQAERQKAMGGRAKTCTFCKSNGESAEIYTSHSLKDSNVSNIEKMATKEFSDDLNQSYNILSDSDPGIF